MHDLFLCTGECIVCRNVGCEEEHKGHNTKLNKNRPKKKMMFKAHCRSDTHNIQCCCQYYLLEYCVLCAVNRGANEKKNDKKYDRIVFRRVIRRYI